MSMCVLFCPFRSYKLIFSKQCRVSHVYIQPCHRLLPCTKLRYNMHYVSSCYLLWSCVFSVHYICDGICKLGSYTCIRFCDWRDIPSFMSKFLGWNVSSYKCNDRTVLLWNFRAVGQKQAELYSLKVEKLDVYKIPFRKFGHILVSQAVTCYGVVYSVYAISVGHVSGCYLLWNCVSSTYYVLAMSQAVTYCIIVTEIVIVSVVMELSPCHPITSLRYGTQCHNWCYVV